MEYAVLPDRLFPEAASGHKVDFVPYASHTPVIKGKSSLKKHLISLITEGEKFIHVGDKTIHVTPRNILLLASGNYLYTERFRPHEQIRSTMVFFDDDLLQGVLGPLATGKAGEHRAAGQPFALFPKDDYLEQYIQSIQLLMETNCFPEALQLAKLNELLTFLYARYPEPFAHFQRVRQKPDEERIKQVMEENLCSQLSIGELAFLCYMSLPTFKRKFQQIYHQSPAKWLQGRRLAIAADLLQRKGIKPGDVYAEAGYENHSSFSKAFKLHFGVLPKDYGQ